MPVVTILAKVILFLINRKEFLQMLRYTQDNFWFAQHDEYATKLLEEINKKGIILICTFTFFVQGTVVTYMLAPIIGILTFRFSVHLVESKTRVVNGV